LKTNLLASGSAENDRLRSPATAPQLLARGHLRGLHAVKCSLPYLNKTGVNVEAQKIIVWKRCRYWKTFL